MKKKSIRPSEQAARLKFWLCLANAVPPEKDEKILSAGKPEEITSQPWPKLPSNVEQEFLRRFELESRSPLRRNVLERLKKRLPLLAVSVAFVLRAFARGAPEYHFETFSGIVEDPKSFEDISLGSAWKNRHGKIDSWFINPRELFLDDLRGAEVDRIRECSVCSRLFFANRKDRRCCRPECANLRRVRRSRGKQAGF